MRATTTGGPVEGLERNGVLQFRGIPYAAPTGGLNRFRPPQPVEPWSGVRDATEHGPIAPQLPGGMEAMLGGTLRPHAEDCLSLSVTTPSLEGARPVMVWIHGGGFTGGSGSVPWYDGTTLALRGDVVVVTINYRLGALGFLHVGPLLGEDRAGAGNGGIQDQIAALGWVRDNIAAFGGDPERVTVFGESAGGMSVTTLMGSPAAAGLFHRAVAQSGAGRHVSSPEGASDVAATVLRHLGSDDPTVLLDAPLEEVLRAQQAATVDLVRDAVRDLRVPFQPVVDGVVLPEHPLDAIAGGHAADIPLLAGTTAEEWRLFHLMSGSGPLDEDRLARRCERLLGEGRGDEAVATYRKAAPDASPDDVWVDICTDRVFRIPALRLADAQVAHQPDVWMYRFDHRTGAFGGRLGACHAVEIPFVFDALDAKGIELFLGPIDEPARTLARRTSDAWLAFAHGGAPGHADLPEWPAHDPVRRPVLALGAEPTVLEDPTPERTALWD